MERGMSENSEKLGDSIAYQYDETMDNLMCSKTLRQPAHDRLSQERSLGRDVEPDSRLVFVEEDHLFIRTKPDLLVLPVIEFLEEVDLAEADAKKEEKALRPVT
ncbi:hypothetical protein ACSAZL_05870 [Methanosarcina sp. T3]|uniref:hypothetical protein n=1 Tax=Methanosarcina sp. T3 TaxID=3439062 RepID=UPI003F8727DA